MQIFWSYTDRSVALPCGEGLFESLITEEIFFKDSAPFATKGLVPKFVERTELLNYLSFTSHKNEILRSVSIP